MADKDQGDQAPLIVTGSGTMGKQEGSRQVLRLLQEVVTQCQIFPNQFMGYRVGQPEPDDRINKNHKTKNI